MVDANLFRRVRNLLRRVLERKEIGTNGTISDPYEPPSTPSLVLNLPSEMILNITDFLDQETKVLLSLTCKPLRDLLNSHLDLSLSDVAIRTKFLQILERELPDYLTCRACGWMFLWRKRVRWFHCSCPRATAHLTEHWWAHAYVPICPLHCMMVTPEMVDLVRRAYYRGPQHGIPFPFMNSNHKGCHNKTLQTQARMVDGDLMLVSRSTVDMIINEKTTKSSYYLEQAICLHRLPSIVDSLWREITSKAHSADCTNGSIIYKCPQCTTDCEIQLQKLEEGQFKIIVQVWRSFGDGSSESLGVQQMFKSYLTRRLDPEALSKRNLSAKFASQGMSISFPVACQHEVTGEPRLTDEEDVKQLNRDQVLVSNGKVCC